MRILLPFVLNVAAFAQSGLTITVTPNPGGVPTGQPVTLTATVSPVSTGFVSFLNGDQILGSAPLSSSQASITTTFHVSGKPSIKAVYRATSGAAPSASGAATVTVTSQAPAGFVAMDDFVSIAFPPVFADVNNDGRVDLMSFRVPGSNQAHIQLNQGNGSYSAVNLRGFAGWNALAGGDFDGDGKVDLAFFNGRTVATARGNGDTSFGNPATAWTLAGPGDPLDGRAATADLNQDGRADLLVSYSDTNFNTRVTALFSNGTIFTEAFTITGFILNIVRADFNGDGKVDIAGTGAAGACPLALSSPSGYNVGVWPCLSTDTLRTGDFNGDSKPDLLLKPSTSLANQYAPLYVFVGQGDGTFAPPKIVVESSSAKPLVVDWNADGLSDVVAKTIERQVGIYLSKPDATLQTPFQIAASDANAALFYDLNSDGFQDLLGNRTNYLTPIYATAGIAPTPGPAELQVFSALHMANATFVDQNGVGEIAAGYLLINDTATETGGCLIRAEPTPLGTIQFALRNAGATGWIPTERGGEWQVGAGHRPFNNICAIDVIDAVLPTEGSFQMRAGVRFSPGFLGQKRAFVRVVDRAGNDTGYVDRGAVTIVAQAGAYVTVAADVQSSSNPTFTVTAEDPDGVADIQTVNFLVGTGINGANACMVELTLPGRTLRLFSDAGTGLSAPIAAGSAGILENNQCRISVSAVQVTTQGLKLTMTLPVFLKGRLAGTRDVAARAVAPSGQDSGFRARIAYDVPGIFPNLLSLTPTTGAGVSGRFRGVFTHPGGASQHYLGYILLLPTPNITAYTAKGSCLVEYNRISRGVRLINDAGTGWLGVESGVPIAPGAQPLSNSYCTVDVASSTAVVNETTMTFEAAVTFKQPDFGGVLGTFLQSLDVNGLWTDMRQFGNWVPYAGWQRYGPYVNAVMPQSGAGSTVTFSASLGHTFGPTGVSRVHLLIDTAIIGAAPCHIVYFPHENTLNVINDDGSALVHPVGVTLGAPGANIIANSRCAVNPAAAARSTQGNNITVNIPLTFTSAFNGAKNVYLNVFDAGGLLTHWVQTGIWTVQ